MPLKKLEGKNKLNISINFLRLVMKMDEGVLFFFFTLKPGYLWYFDMSLYSKSKEFRYDYLIKILSFPFNTIYITYYPYTLYDALPEIFHDDS